MREITESTVPGHLEKLLDDKELTVSDVKKAIEYRGDLDQEIKDVNAAIEKHGP